MMIGMVAIWGLVAWAIVSLVRSPNRPRRRGSDSAEKILAGRLAAGEIEGDEFQHRLDVLPSGKVPTGKWLRTATLTTNGSRLAQRVGEFEMSKVSARSCRRRYRDWLTA